MEIKNWLSIAAGVFLVGMMLYGHYRGFLRQCVSIAALVITLAAVRFATPYITDVIRENPEINQAISDSVSRSLGLSQLPQDQDGTPSWQREMIEGLQLPQFVKDGLVENNNNEIYEMLGVQRFVEYVSSYVSGIMINAVVSIVVFIATFIVIQVLMRMADLLSRLPILSGLNQIAGALLGLAHGLILLWVGLLLLNLFSATQLGSLLMSQVENSLWLSFLNQFNLLSIIFKSVI